MVGNGMGPDRSVSRPGAVPARFRIVLSALLFVVPLIVLMTPAVSSVQAIVRRAPTDLASVYQAPRLPPGLASAQSRLNAQLSSTPVPDPVSTAPSVTPAVDQDPGITTLPATGSAASDEPPRAAYILIVLALLAGVGMVIARFAFGKGAQRSRR